MQGSVYLLSLSNIDDGKKHPYLVVIAFSGNRDCIVIPAYSADGPAVNDFISRCRSSGMRDDHIVVRMDNGQHIESLPSDLPGKEAYWCIAKPHRLPQRMVLAGRYIGTMRPMGMLMIVSAILDALKDENFRVLMSPNAVKTLKNYHKQLAIECSSTVVREDRPRETPPGSGAGI
jgi:hypothetical protein